MPKRLGTLFTIVGLLVTLVSLASDSDLLVPSPKPRAKFSEWHFTRIAYNALGGGFGRERWLTDYPEAEEHLIQGVRRLSRIDTDPEGVQISLLDDQLFDFPWLYAVEVGGWYLNDQEAARLRDYLLRGGFLMVDDFHGSYEWEG